MSLGGHVSSPNSQLQGESALALWRNESSREESSPVPLFFPVPQASEARSRHVLSPMAISVPRTLPSGPKGRAPTSMARRSWVAPGPALHQRPPLRSRAPPSLCSHSLSLFLPGSSASSGRRPGPLEYSAPFPANPSQLINTISPLRPQFKCLGLKKPLKTHRQTHTHTRARTRTH